MIQRTRKAEHNRQTQFGPKHSKKNSDLRHRLNAVSNIDEVKCAIASGGLPSFKRKRALLISHLTHFCRL